MVEINSSTNKPINTLYERLYLRGTGISLVTLFAELCCLVPWITWLVVTLYDFTEISFFNSTLAFLLGTLALLVTRFLLAVNISLNFKRVIFLLLGFLAIWVFLSLHYDTSVISHILDLRITNTIFLLIPAAMIIWWRGIHHGLTEMNIHHYIVFFIRGFLAFIVLIFLVHFQSSIPYFSRILNLTEYNRHYLVGFFILALLGLGLNNVLSSEGKDKKKKGVAFFRPSLLVLLMVIGVIVVAAFALSADNWQVVVFPLSAIWSVLGKILFFIFSLFQHPVAWAIQWLQQFIRDPEPLIPDVDLTPGATPDIEVTVTDYALNIPDLTAALQWALVILTIGLLTFLIVRIIMRFKPQREERKPEETHENLFSWRILTDDLKALFHFWDKPLNIIKKAGQRLRRVIPPSGYFSDARSIFRAFLSWAEKKGYGRKKSETPEEYSKRLVNELDSTSGYIRPLTGYYEAERYGCKELSPDQLAEANRHLEDLVKIIDK